MSDDVLLVESISVGDSLVEVWTINREKNLNALNSAVLERVKESANKLNKTIHKNKVRGLIIKGSGIKAFAAGADIVEMKDYGGAEAQAFSELGQAAFGALENLEIPTIAAVDGFALGGGLELAMGCDLIFATPKSKFGQPEATLGLIPGFGATARLVEKMGRSKALEYFYSSEMISAAEAERWGLIERVVAEGSAFEAALDYLKIVISKNGPIALSEIKRVTGILYRERIEKICRHEAKAFGKIFETQDKAEGVGAFLEKRSPKFKGL
jgi:enoyl-CoA hydratase